MSGQGNLSAERLAQLRNERQWAASFEAESVFAHIDGQQAELDRLAALVRQLVDALDGTAQAFDSQHPGACHQDCFDTSDGHGYEMQEAARERYQAALDAAREQGFVPSGEEARQG